MQQFFKKIADTSIYICLVSKPEQESALLSMLVEKLGDPDVTVPFLFPSLQSGEFSRRVFAAETGSRAPCHAWRSVQRSPAIAVPVGNADPRHLLRRVVPESDRVYVEGQQSGGVADHVLLLAV